MRVELLLPALTEAKSPFFRPVKYALGRALPILERVLSGEGSAPRRPERHLAPVTVRMGPSLRIP